MKIQKKYWFTLIELVISISILFVVLSWISYSVFNLSWNVEKISYEVKIFDDLNDFIVDKNLFYYSSWVIITWSWKYDTILLYNSNNGYLISVFNDFNWWKNYKISGDKNTYKKDYLWYFKINKQILDNFLLNTWSLYSFEFNNWKIYKNLLVNDFFITPYNTWSIFQIDMSTLKNFNQNYIWKDKTFLNILEDDLSKFNLVF